MPLIIYCFFYFMCVTERRSKFSMVLQDSWLMRKWCSYTDRGRISPSATLSTTKLTSTEIRLFRLIRDGTPPFVLFKPLIIPMLQLWGIEWDQSWRTGIRETRDRCPQRARWRNNRWEHRRHSSDSGLLLLLGTRWHPHQSQVWSYATYPLIDTHS